MSESKGVIGISYSEEIPRELIDSFLDELGHEDVELVEDLRPATRFFAGVEWYLPTAVAVFLSKGYFDAFLKAAGSDHYALLKRVLPRWFARLSRKRVTYLASGSKKLTSDNPFTGAISLLGEGQGIAFKLLFRTDADEMQIAQAIGAFLDLLERINAGGAIADNVLEFDPDVKSAGLVLVYFDGEAQALRMLDPRSARTLQSETDHS